MVSRIKGLVEWLKGHAEYLDYEGDKIPRIAETNFDLRDVVDSTDIIKEFHEQGFDIFTEQANNDGMGFVLVEDDGTVKYCFTDGDITAPLTAEQYMEWDNCLTDTEEEDGSNFTENCKFLSEHALMTDDELRAFIDTEYKNVSGV